MRHIHRKGQTGRCNICVIPYADFFRSEKEKTQKATILALLPTCRVWRLELGYVFGSRIEWLQNWCGSRDPANKLPNGTVLTASWTLREEWWLRCFKLIFDAESRQQPRPSSHALTPLRVLAFQRVQSSYLYLRNP